MPKLFRQLLLLLVLIAGPALVHAQAKAGFYYTVQKTEPLAVVAKRFGMSEAELARANRMAAGARLGRGSRLWIPKAPVGSSPAASKPQRPTPAPVAKPQAAPKKVSSPTAASAEGSYTVRSGDSLWGVANRHGLTVDELSRLNGISSRAQLKVGQVLVVSGRSNDVPGGGVAKSQPTASEVISTRIEEPVASSTSSGSGSSTRPSSRGFIWPIEGRILRSYRNTSDEKYTGIDIGAPRGTEVRAARDGVVLYAGDGIPSYGNMVIVSHEGGLASCYAQLDRILVKKDQAVRRGQVIGRSGDPGRGREPYLHFEIRRNGEAVDPEPYLP